MDGWMAGWMDGWMDGWLGGWMDGWMYGCTDRRTGGWADGRMDGWMDPVKKPDGPSTGKTLSPLSPKEKAVFYTPNPFPISNALVLNSFCNPENPFLQPS